MGWSLHSTSTDNKCLSSKEETIFKFWPKCNCCILKKPCQHFRKDLKAGSFLTAIWKRTKPFVCWGCEGRDWGHLWYFQHWAEIDLSGRSLGRRTTSTKLSLRCGCHGGWCVPWIQISGRFSPTYTKYKSGNQSKTICFQLIICILWLMMCQNIILYLNWTLDTFFSRSRVHQFQGGHRCWSSRWSVWMVYEPKLCMMWGAMVFVTWWETKCDDPSMLGLGLNLSPNNGWDVWDAWDVFLWGFLYVVFCLSSFKDVVVLSRGT